MPRNARRAKFLHLGPEYEARFLESFSQSELVLEALTRSDVERVTELVRQYSEFPLGTVDASVVAVAERLDVSQIATLDWVHFRRFGPAISPASSFAVA